MSSADLAAIRRGRTTAALVLTVVALAVFNIARSTVLPEGADLAANVVMAGVVAGLAWWADESADELGLARRRLGRGLAYGALAAGLVAAVLLAASTLSAFADFFDDDRAEVSGAELLFELTVAIPFGTVLLEELAFRGSLLALLRRRTSTLTAVAVSSVLFGLWHIAPAITSSGNNAGLESSGIGLAASVAGTVLLTSAAGVALCWLRLRSDSLVAPVLAHLAINGISLTLAWGLAQG